MVGRSLSHYKIVDKLGEGGMGVVYKARDTHLDRLVAIKVLPPDRVADPERRRRFVQEAKTASALNHPNIVVVHDINQDQGIHFIAMEYVAGRTLDKLIPRKGMQVLQALAHAIQIADALAAAHRAGIVHRDIKPTNIMVTEDGRVKVLDFGLAKLTEAGELAEDEATRTVRPMTEEGVIIGTAAYMSPEQVEGRKLDARSDVFSFGAVLYEMITGQEAFRRGTKMSTLSAVLKEEPKPAAEVTDGVPRDLEKIIARCLRKETDRRFQTMADVLVQLREVKEESDSGTAIRPRASRKRKWPWVVAAAAALLAAFAGWWLLRRPPADRTLRAPLVAVPLTSFPGFESAPSFSPDGNHVAFVWNGEKQDNYDVYVKLIGPGTPLRLTSNPAYDTSPAWSPDGRWIAFRRLLGAGKAGLFIIPALGGPERKLLEIAGGTGSWGTISWHPGGEWLAFVGRDPPDAPSAVFAVSVASGQKRRLTTPVTASGGSSFPAFSPDGLSLAFCQALGLDEGPLFVLSLSAALEPRGEPKRLTSDHGNCLTPAWTSDGRDIIYSAGWPGNYKLWRVGVPAPGAAPAKPERLPSVGEDGIFPALSRQGNRLAYTRSWRDLNIWRVQIPGGNPEIFISSTRSEEDPRFSPDGRKIAFRSDRSGYNEIWVCNADGTSPVQLTAFNGPMNADPSWSPDGWRIAFKSTANGPGDIYVIDAEGGSPVRFTTDPSDEQMPAWSGDGRWVYFASNRSGTDQIWKVPSVPSGQGGAALQVTRKGGFCSQESPDGQFLYYGKDRNPVTSLWKVPVAGGDETQVLESITWWLNFAVTDQGIYFIPAGTPPAIRFLRLATGRIEPVVTLTKPSAAGMTVSPDGRTLLFTMHEQDGSDIMLVENFR